MMVSEEYVKSLYYSYQGQVLKKQLDSIRSLERNSVGKIDDESISLDDLGKLYAKTRSNSLKDFVELGLSKDKVDDLIAEIGKNEEKLLDGVKTMAYDSSVFRKELDAIRKLKPEEAAEKIDMYNDGSYITLPSYVYAISWICRLNGFWDAWIKLYDAMKVFPLKGALLFGLKTPEECLYFANKQKSKPSSIVDIKLLQDVFFRIICESQDILTKNAESKTLSEEYRSAAKKFLHSLDETVGTARSEFIDISIHSLGLDKTVDWIMGLKNRFSEDSRFNHFRYLEAVELHADLIKKVNSTIIKDVASTDVDNLIFYLSVCDPKMTEISEGLLKNLMAATYSGNFKLREPDTSGVEDMRSVYKHLSSPTVTIWKRIGECRKRIEGYDVDKDGRLNNLYGDRFWLSVLMLRLEETQNEEEFKSLVEILIRLASQSFDKGDFFIPMYIGELIASQVLTECKDWYELKLIHEYCDLVEVLRVLCGNNGEFSDKVKADLTARLKKEWQYEKGMKSSYNQNVISFLEDFMHSSGISFEALKKSPRG